MVQSMQSLYAYGRAFDVALIGAAAAAADRRDPVRGLRLVPGRCARLAAPAGGAPLRPRRHARARALSHSRRHHAGQETARPARTGTVAGSWEVTSSRNPHASAVDGDDDRGQQPPPRVPADDGAEQRRGEEVEPAHARVAEVDLLQRGQRLGALRVTPTCGRAVCWRASRSTSPQWCPTPGTRRRRSARSGRARGSGRRDRPDDARDRETGSADQERLGDLGDVAVGLPGDHVEHRGRGHRQEGGRQFAMRPSAAARAGVAIVPR